MLMKLVDKLPRGQGVTAGALALGIAAIFLSLVILPAAQGLLPAFRYPLLGLLAYEGWSLLDGVARNTLSEVYVRTALRYPMLPYAVGCANGAWHAYVVMQSMHGVPITPNDVAAMLCVNTLMGHLNWQFASPEPQPPLDRTP